MSDVSEWLDNDGACKICEGEIPYGHNLNCFIYQKELEIKELEQQLSNSISKDELRGLVVRLDEVSGYMSDKFVNRDSKLLHADETIEALNKLIEGGKDQ